MWDFSGDEFLFMFAAVIAGGAAWIFLTPELFTFAGISVSDDTIVRKNPAAAVAVSGAMVGVMFSYAGSNVGNGPTIWTTLLPAYVATVSLFVAWLTMELMGGARRNHAGSRSGCRRATGNVLDLRRSNPWPRDGGGLVGLDEYI